MAYSSKDIKFFFTKTSWTSKLKYKTSTTSYMSQEYTSFTIANYTLHCWARNKDYQARITGTIRTCHPMAWTIMVDTWRKYFSEVWGGTQLGPYLALPDSICSCLISNGHNGGLGTALL